MWICSKSSLYIEEAYFGSAWQSEEFEVSFVWICSIIFLCTPKICIFNLPASLAAYPHCSLLEQATYLNQHVRRVHEKIKKFKCELCELTAVNGSNLTQHVRAVHAKEKNFNCELCEYTASQAPKLRRHILGVHGKVRNFKCEQCEYSASQAHHLKRHVIAQHDKN